MAESRSGILVSPAERHPALLDLGRVSALPERFGADFMWMGKCGKWGVQRKEIKDLLASVGDGRLARERGMWGKLDQAVLMVEGRVRYDAEGVLMTGGRGGGGYGRTWKLAEVQGVLATVQREGTWVFRTENQDETAMSVRALEKWSRKDRHSGVAGREPLTSVWGRPTNREYAVYLLSGLPGVGVELAGRVVERFGRLPWQWEPGVGVKELMDVPGVGKKKAEAMMKALGRTEGLDGWE